MVRALGWSYSSIGLRRGEHERSDATVVNENERPEGLIEWRLQPRPAYGARPFAPATTRRGRVNPDYSGGVEPETDTGDDVAILVNDATWPSIASTKDDWIRVAYGSTRNGVNGNAVRNGDRFKVVGFGASNPQPPITSGVLRTDPDLVKIDWLGSAHFFDEASSVRVCEGDSGSPALVFADTTPITVGTLSSVSSKTGFCANSGAKQRWSLTQHNIDWIRSMLQSLGSCTNKGYVVSATLGYSVVECSQ